MGTTFKRALIACTAATALAAVPAAAKAQPQAAQNVRITIPPLKFSERRLANGLRLISMPDPTTRNVSVSVWYEVGSKHDPQGRSGFAHLFEHILSRKTRNMPYNMINALVEDVGGSRNASTAYDRTNYYEIVPARYLETMLWTHAERMARPVIDPQVFESERNVVKEEFRQGVLAPPYGRLRLLLTENAWDTSPHRRPGIGSIEQLDAAKLEDARSFHEAYYGPDTATLIVSGNFDEKQLNAWVDRYFASIPPRARKVPLVISQNEPERTVPRVATMYSPNVPLPVIGSVWRTPSYAHADTPALMLLDRILTEGDSSRLYRALVHEKQLATQIGGQTMMVEEQGAYAPLVYIASGKSVPEAQAALAAEIAKLRDAPVTAAELSEAKNEFLADTLRQRETFSGRASGLGEALVRSGDPKAWDRIVANVQRVTVADVQRVARTYLRPNARVDVQYLNEKERPQAAGENGWLNPVPMPQFKSVPPAVKPAIEHAADAVREKPPAPGPAVPVTPLAISDTRLPTGLSIVTARSSDVPLATMTVVLKGGAATHPRNQAGLVNLAADVATKGTTSRSAQQIAAELESLGAVLSGSGGADGTMLSVSAPAANLEAAGRVLADIVQNATFPAAEFERERKRAIDALSVALKNPGAIASLVAQSLVYGDAPYGTPATGTPSSLRSLTREDLAAYHRNWWHPANTALVVSGGIDAGTANAMAARLFGNWKGQGPAPALPAQRAGPPRPPKVLVVDMPGAGQAAVLAAVRSLGRSDPDYYNLSVANAVLGVGSTGRLFEEVRTKRALSYGASSGFPPRMDASILSASAQTKNETAPEVAQVILGELDRLGREPLPSADVERRISFLTGSISRQMETSGGVGNMLANLVQNGLAPSEAARVVQQMEAVTPAAASAVAARLIGADRATLVIVGDASKFLDRLKAARPDVEVISLTELDLDAPTLRTKE